MKFKEIKTDEEISKLTMLASFIWFEYWPDKITLKQTNYMVNKFQSFEAIKSQIENEDYVYNIFYDDNKTIGYFGISPKDDCLFLSKLYVEHDFRGLGCGKAALNRIKQYAQKFNKKCIKLTVNKNNTPAIKAYESWGFHKTDSVVSDIGEGFVMDDYIMEYEF